MKSKGLVIEQMKKMISVIMPVYNSEKYVAEAIESICNQSYENWVYIPRPLIRSSA